MQGLPAKNRLGQEQKIITGSLVANELTHWILDIFSAAVSHGLSILGTKRKFGGHILKLRFLI